ncbi:NACHT, LRR and PYD domains-containing protein 12-like [Corythoichthys intestinalis]|uniref:NACHT, LRR and PYD domains-containing protein 12-like n=1 Tax=Corythoichthys intestinalis TaxID=161448 RepID=UPI0025A5B8D7|nr:NACHT, LRR and PYD domains-containing protein 12-like [Corythoichthys intestinalis]
MALDSGCRDLLWKTLRELGEDDFESFRFHTDLPQSVRENTRQAYIADELIKKHGQNTLYQTILLLEKIGNINLAEKLRSNMLKIEGAVFSVDDDDQINRLKGELQEHLKGSYKFASEDTAERWEDRPLADVYTELDVTYGADVSPDGRHEVLQMETCATTAKESILPCNIFKSPDRKRRPIRTMLTVGFAGIGKTFLIQKFVWDWATGEKNQDVHFIFPFTFRELNMDKEKSFTLAELIRCYVCKNRHMSKERLNNIFAKLQMSDKQDYESSRFKILFILDGLDECNFKIDLENTGKVDMDVGETYPLDVLLAHLINRNLLPCARVWISTRPGAARKIPSNLIDSRTEVRGFSDSMRLEYFRKKFPNDEHVIEHIRKSHTIFIMCHMPIFCWLIARVLQDYLKKGKKGELPTTLTDMYSAFVGRHLVNSEERNTTEYKLDMKALAKLAFHHTMNNNQIFYDKDLEDSGFDYGQAAKHCGLFTEVFKEVDPLKSKKQKMFQFIHLTIQEYLAAFYVMMCFFHDKKNILDDSGWSLENCVKLWKQKKITQVHRSALQKASESEGHLDLFLRFLLGLSLPCNNELVKDLLKAPQDCGQSKSKTVKLIRKRIKRNTPEKNVNLFYCLNELKDNSLQKQIQQELNQESGRLSRSQMSNEMWSALAFFLLTDDKTMKSFNLASYSPSRLGLEKLLVVVKASKKSDLANCKLDKGSCHLLASVLNSQANLRHLDLSYNRLSDEGVEILSKGLSSPHCILQVLKLKNCKITKRGCLSLAEKLELSHLEELDLSHNDLSDEGVENLSKGLASPHCKLKVLNLSACLITMRRCLSLAEALKLNSSHLQELDLSKNNLSDEGVGILSEGLASQHCNLKVLNLSKCWITNRGCVSLAEALKLNNSYLQEFDLSENKLLDEGINILSKGLASPHCILKLLKLSDCGITSIGCVSLAETLKINPSQLQELDLSYNDLSDEGVKILSKGLACPHCNVKVLKLLKCKITGEGCVSLAEALKLNPSHLEELDLKGNQIGKRGVRVLLEIKEDPSYSLKTVW